MHVVKSTKSHDEDTMRLIITVDDPAFLKKPFVYALLEAKKPGGLVPIYRGCDPGVARREVEEGYAGNKYPEDDKK